MSLIKRILTLVVTFAFLSVPAAQAGSGILTRLTDSDQLEWDQALSLPDGHIGVAGAFAGVSGDRIVLAGGANFPDGLPADGGVKKFWRDAYVYSEKGGWALYENVLPEPVAYGVSVPLKGGVLCIGGNTGNGLTGKVYLMKVGDNGIDIDEWPSMPVALAEAAGCLVDGKVYVAGGVVDDGTVSSSRAFCMDLSTRQWTELAEIPGGDRTFAVAAAQSDGFDTCFWVFGGRGLNPDGTWDYRTDGWCYNPRLNEWKAAEGEFPVMAGSAVPLGTNHILFLGGRDASNADDRILRLYHTVTRTMIEKDVPEGVDIPVTAHAVTLPDGSFMIASGEVKPGIRTPMLLKGHIQSEIHKLKFIDYLMIVLYFLLLVGIGWFFSGRQKNADDYFKGGGRIPWIIAGLSIFGTALSAITFMSIPAKAFHMDWSYMLYNAGIVLVVPIIVLMFVPFFRKLNVTSAYEYLEQRFNAPVRVICSVAFILFQVGRMGVILLLPAIALNIVTGINILFCVCMMGVFSLLYTMMGGIEAVAWTDALQVVVLLGAAIAVLVIAVCQVPGGASAAIVETARAGKMSLGSAAFDLRQPTIWTTLIASMFTCITTYGTDQTIVQRYMTTATQKEARKGVYVNAALTIPATLIFFSVGTAIWAFYKHFPHEMSVAVQSQDAILPWYISTQLPNGVLGLVIAGIFAAAMSTLSSSMNSAATAFSADIWSKITKQPQMSLKGARIVTLIIGALGVVFAVMMSTLEIKSLWDEFSKLLGLLLGGLGGLFLLGLTCRRASSAGAIAGLVASIVTQLIFLQGGWINLLLYSTTGFISCFVVGWLVSLVVPNRKDISGLTVYK